MNLARVTLSYFITPKNYIHHQPYEIVSDIQFSNLKTLTKNSAFMVYEQQIIREYQSFTMFSNFHLNIHIICKKGQCFPSCFLSKMTSVNFSVRDISDEDISSI